MPYPDRFYPVVDSIAWVTRLAALGVGTIQLRAKDLDDSQSLQLVSDALAVTRGNQIKAAELLGLNRNTLRKKVRDLDIRWIRSPR